MPQLPQSFSAYPITVTLDGTGRGAVSFQATGSNLRITNISVRATSADNQAVATVYKGQIGDPYRLSGTNSGSTGDSISTPIDLFDGETVYVVWTGGDVGATATATFSGNAIPKGDVGQASGGNGWSNPIAAGDGSLIYPALKSPNYVPDTDGWQIDRTGEAEFFRLLVRAGSMTVRNDTSGASVAITPGDIGIYPVDGVNVSKSPGTIRVNLVDNAATGYGQMTIQSAGTSTSQDAQIALRSSTLDGIGRKIILAGDVEVHTGELTNTADSQIYQRGLRGTHNFALSAVTNATQAIVFSTPFTVAPTVTTNIRSGDGTLRGWGSRALNVTTTGFTLFIFSPLTTSATSSVNPLPVDWIATV
jgi:hypothetical protein